MTKNKPCKLVGTVGGPCAGKTLLALELTVQLKLKGYDARYLEEYATEYIEQTGPPLHFLETTRIAQRQIEMENRVLFPASGRQRDFVITGSASFLSPVYLRQYPPDLSDTAVLLKYQHTLKTEDDRARKEFIPRYDLILFPIFEHGFVQDAVRYQANEDDTREIEQRLRVFLNENRVPYIELTGTLQERVEKAAARLFA